MENSYTNKWLYNGYTVISIANVNAIETAIHIRESVETAASVRLGFGISCS